MIVRSKCFARFKCLSKISLNLFHRYVEHYSKWLSTNHYRLTEVRLTMAQIIGTGGPQIIQTISDRHLNLKIKLCQDLLKLYAIIAPSEARLLGSLRFELHSVLAEIGRREAEKKNSNFKGALEDSLFSAEMCMNLLKYEPKLLPEGHICSQAITNSNSLRTILGLN